MYLKKILAALLALILAAALSACAQKNDNGGEEPQKLVLTEAQTERIYELAQTFSLFGPVDMQEGFPVSRLEYLIPCFWSGRLEEAELEGYGRITVEEADATVEAMLPGVKVPDLYRTKYDPTQDQDYFTLNGYYYIRRTDASNVKCEIESVSELTDEKGSVTGVRATVKVTENGKPRAGVTLELPYSKEHEFSILKCIISEYE